ncbi:MAG: hypothetical protein V4538_15495 [Bacteroidota bacterium]
MSDNELHIGILKKVEKLDDDTIEMVIIRILNNEKIDYHDLEESLFDILKDNFYDKYFVFKGELYYAEDTEPHDSGDAFCELNKNEDGSISYVTSFYNGGTCFSEMIEETLETFNP